MRRRQNFHFAESKHLALFSLSGPENLTSGRLWLEYRDLQKNLSFYLR